MEGNNEFWEPFQKGNGEIHLSFNENDKQQKYEMAQIIIKAAKAEGIETILDEGITPINGLSPKFIISFVNVPKDLMMQFGDLQIELETEKESV